MVARPEPSITVVMPAGAVNAELRRALACLVEQTTTRAWNLVVSLNTPDAGARASLTTLLADTSLDAEVIDSSAVRSAAFARNTGANHASGDLLAFCDSDDEADPTWLDEIVNAMEPGVAVGGHLREDKLVIEGQEPVSYTHLTLPTKA